MAPTIYLDHAATSWPKPAAVVAAVTRWFTELGVSAERGDGPHQRAVADEVASARLGLGARLALPPERIAFVSGATEGLNLALRALLRPGARVVTTALEHSSVARPLRTLTRERGLRLDVVPLRADGQLAEDDVLAALRAAPTDLLVFTHASNVTGQLLAADGLCEAARAAGTATLLDASQTAGLAPLAVGADVVVASAHKALLAPPGLGFVAVRRGLELAPQKQGGTGSSAALDEHPSAWPQAFEAGTPNTPAILGLAAALRARTPTLDAAALAAANARADELARALMALDGVQILGSRSASRVPVFSLRHAHYDPAELAAILGNAGIHTRSGHHCAPWIHRDLGTTAGGTLRLSPGEHLSSSELATVVDLFASL